METPNETRDEMLDLAERFADLDDEQWNFPSLCAAWRIRDVLAHLIAGAEDAFGFVAIVGGMLRHGFNFNRWVAADGKSRGQQDPAVLLKALRNAAAKSHAQRQPDSVYGLMHVLIHGQDMCRPLGVKRDLPESHLLRVADFVKDDTHRFGTKKRIAGLRLIATDMEWSHGLGPEVTGPGEALVMVMAGRRVALDDISGEGKVALVTRS